MAAFFLFQETRPWINHVPALIPKSESKAQHWERHRIQQGKQENLRSNRWLLHSPANSDGVPVANLFLLKQKMYGRVNHPETLLYDEQDNPLSLDTDPIPSVKLIFDRTSPTQDSFFKLRWKSVNEEWLTTLLSADSSGLASVAFLNNFDLLTTFLRKSRFQSDVKPHSSFFLLLRLVITRCNRQPAIASWHTSTTNLGNWVFVRGSCACSFIK